jgi:hypothetical protein
LAVTFNVLGPCDKEENLAEHKQDVTNVLSTEGNVKKAENQNQESLIATCVFNVRAVFKVFTLV